MDCARVGVWWDHIERRKNTILSLLELFDDRFVHYPSMMKTKTGRKKAEKAWSYVLEFKKEMMEQATCEALLESS
jgi:uncharacterized protein